MYCCRLQYAYMYVHIYRYMCVFSIVRAHFVLGVDLDPEKPVKALECSFSLEWTLADYHV